MSHRPAYRKQDVPSLPEVLEARPNAAYLPNSAPFVPDPSAPIQGVVVMAHWQAREVWELDRLLDDHAGKTIWVIGLDDCLTPEQVAAKLPGVSGTIDATPIAAIYTHGSLYGVLRKDPIATLSRWLEDD